MHSAENVTEQVKHCKQGNSRHQTSSQVLPPCESLRVYALYRSPTPGHYVQARLFKFLAVFPWLQPITL